MSRPMPDEVRSLGLLDMERHLADPALKQAFVTPMFDLIAPRYDRFTRAFSFGMDRRWKATLVEMAATTLRNGASVADVATGTGDLALALVRARPDVEVTATDVSGRMLALAATRVVQQRARVAVAGGDLSALPFPSASLDGITAGYALRNAPDWRSAVAELSRVIRPGGHLFTLDFYLPAFAPWRAAFLAWLALAGRGVGWWWHREPLAYGYIARSIELFTSADGLARSLAGAGFEVRDIRQRLGGGIAIHHAVRR